MAAPAASGDFLRRTGGADGRRRCWPRPQVGRRWRPTQGREGGSPRQRPEEAGSAPSAGAAPPAAAATTSFLRCRADVSQPPPAHAHPLSLSSLSHTHTRAAAGGETGNTGCRPVLHAAESPRRGRPGPWLFSARPLSREGGPGSAPRPTLSVRHRPKRGPGGELTRGQPRQLQRSVPAAGGPGRGGAGGPVPFSAACSRSALLSPSSASACSLYINVLLGSWDRNLPTETLLTRSNIF